MAWAPTDIASLALWVPAYNTSAMWKESDAAAPILTHATTDADAIGQVDDPSPCAHRVYGGSAGTSPVLGSSGSRLSYHTFASASAQRLNVENSLSAFNFIHQGGAVSICVWVLCATDSSDMVIVDSCNLTGANVGFYVYRTSGNKVGVGVAKGGTTMVNFTSAATLNIAAGWVPITITWSGASSTGTFRLGAAGSNENITVGTAVAAGTNATNNITVGTSASSHTSAFNGSISDVVISNSVMSASDLTSYRAYNPARDGTSLAAASATGSTLLPNQLNYLWSWYDFSDTTTLWQDSTLTTPVASNSDPIYTAVNKSSTLALKRDAASDANGHRPLYKTSIQNGRAAALFDGTDDNLIFQQQWASGGAWTAFLVCRMATTNVSAHPISAASGTVYWAVTGSAYGPPSTSVFAVHTGDGLTESPLVNVDSWNILEWVRNGPIVRSWCNGVESSSLVTVATGAMTNIGLANGGAVTWNDYIAELVTYRAVHNETNRSLVRAGLASKWGIGNVKLTSAGGSSRGRSRVGG